MSIEVTQISLEKFEQRQLDFSRSDFMQSAALHALSLGWEAMWVLKPSKSPMEIGL